MRIGKQLERLGVEVIEADSRSSPGPFEAIRAVAGR